MTKGRAKKRTGVRALHLVPAGLVTIVIDGKFDRPGDEVGEIIDNAMHDAGLCGCAGPANGYVLSVKSAMKLDRQTPSENHNGRETARAWIVKAAVGASGQDGDGRSEETE